MTYDYRKRLEPQDSQKTVHVGTSDTSGDVKIADLQLSLMYRALLAHPMKLTRTQPPALAWWKQVFGLKGNKEKIKAEAKKIWLARLGPQDDGYKDRVLKITTAGG